MCFVVCGGIEKFKKGMNAIGYGERKTMK